MSLERCHHNHHRYGGGPEIFVGDGKKLATVGAEMAETSMEDVEKCDVAAATLSTDVNTTLDASDGASATHDTEPFTTDGSDHDSV